MSSTWKDSFYTFLDVLSPAFQPLTSLNSTVFLIDKLNFAIKAIQKLDQWLFLCVSKTLGSVFNFILLFLLASKNVLFGVIYVCTFGIVDVFPDDKSEYEDFDTSYPFSGRQKAVQTQLDDFSPILVMVDENTMATNTKVKETPLTELIMEATSLPSGSRQDSIADDADDEISICEMGSSRTSIVHDLNIRAHMRHETPIRLPPRLHKKR